MSDDAGGNADRDAFLAAVGRVFQEFPDVSKGYGILDVARFAGMVGADVESRDEIRIGSGGTVTVSHGPGGDTLGAPGECIAVVPTTTPEGLPGWECIVFMGP
jgi:hypothetical protein